MLNITLNIDETGFNKQLDTSFITYNKNVTAFKNDITEKIRKVQEDNVLYERDSRGGGLQPLAPITVYLKTKLGFPFPNRILYASGLLSRSVKSDSESEDVSNIYIGNGRDYVAWKQQTGQYTTWFGRTFKLPERHFFGLGALTDKSVQRQIENFSLNSSDKYIGR